MRASPRLAGLAGLAYATAALVAAEADARSCIRHAYEHMSVRRVDVLADGRSVAAPAELAAFDELLNSGGRGEALLFWEHDGDGSVGAKGFGEREAIEPSARQAAYIASWSQSVFRTSCGYSVPYTPILPGRYAFTADRSGSPISQGVVARALTVSGDRQRVTLDFAVGERSYVALYEVVCAEFRWEAEGRVCAPKEPHDDSAPPEVPRSAPERPAPDPEPAPPAHAEPRGCAIDPPAPAAALVVFVFVALVVARRRQR
ncbi:MAG: hypothetical protein R3A79_06265 [Nannocystaceae bacterium]